MFRSRQTLLQSNIFRKSTPATIQGNNEREWFDLFLGLSLCICIFIWVCISVALFLFANNLCIHICIGMSTLSPCAIELPRDHMQITNRIYAKWSPLNWIWKSRRLTFQSQNTFWPKKINFDCLIRYFSSSIITITIIS